MNSDYRLKAIDTITPTGKKHLKILTQAINGPCPLIALVNVLLLRGDIVISHDKAYISFRELTDILGMQLLKKFENLEPGSPTQQQKDLTTILELLPTLEGGLVVNVDHSGIRGFEESPSLLLFRTFGVELVHSWLANPLDVDSWNVIKELRMYESVHQRALEGVDKVTLITELDKLELDFSTAEGEQMSIIQKEIEWRRKLLDDSDICMHFLESTGAQMTVQGIDKLRQELNPDNFYVLYHSNHFSTLYFKGHDQLLLLATDEGFVGKTNCVWQTLDDVMGSESLFLTGDLEPYIDGSEELEARREGTAAMPQAEIDKLIAAQAELGENADPDLALALALQAQENAATQDLDMNRLAAERLQAEEDELFARQIQNQEQQAFDARLAAQHAQPSQSVEPPTVPSRPAAPSNQPANVTQPATIRANQPATQPVSQSASQSAAAAASVPRPVRKSGEKKDKDCVVS